MTFEQELLRYGITFPVPPSGTYDTQLSDQQFQWLHLFGLNAIAARIADQNVTFIETTDAVDVTDAVTVIFPVYAAGRKYIVQNEGPDEVRIAMGGTPSYASGDELGYILAPGEGFGSDVCSSTPVSAVCDTGGTARLTRTIIRKP